MVDVQQYLDEAKIQYDRDNLDRVKRILEDVQKRIDTEIRKRDARLKCIESEEK